MIQALEIHGGRKVNTISISTIHKFHISNRIRNEYLHRSINVRNVLLYDLSCERRVAILRTGHAASRTVGCAH